MIGAVDITSPFLLEDIQLSIEHSLPGKEEVPSYEEIEGPTIIKKK